MSYSANNPKFYLDMVFSKVTSQLQSGCMVTSHPPINPYQFSWFLSPHLRLLLREIFTCLSLLQWKVMQHWTNNQSPPPANLFYHCCSAKQWALQVAGSNFFRRRIGGHILLLIHFLWISVLIQEHFQNITFKHIESVIVPKRVLME